MQQFIHSRARIRATFTRATLTLLSTFVAAGTASAAAPMADAWAVPTGREALVAEALAHNSEIRSARFEHDAALQRRAPAGSLDDPMLEVGIVNAALPPSLRRDDMTMQMLGVSQKLPFPGKRGLRRAVATADALALGFAVDEVSNRVVRDVRVAYEDFVLADRSAAITARSRNALRDIERSVNARYTLGRATQSDVLLAGTRSGQMQQDLLKMQADRRIAESELRRLVGRAADAPLFLPLPNDSAPADTSTADASHRPQIAALHAMEERGSLELALAERDYFPDFELRLGYGHRERSLEGMPRDDVVTMTLAVNLPLWRKDRLEPRVAEARAMRARAAAMVETQRLDTIAALEQQQARADQARQSLILYRTSLLPQVRAAVQAARASYEAGTADFATLLEVTMRDYTTSLSEAETLAAAWRASAEISYLSGISSREDVPGATP